MKIAILSFYSGEVYRGAETFVHELSNHLVRLGHTLDVYQTGPALPGSMYLTHQTSFDLPPKFIPRPNFPFTSPTALYIKSFTHHALSQISPQTDVIIPTNGQWQSWLCTRWAKKHRAKTVISGQSGPGLDDRINLFCFPHIFIALTRFQENWAKAANPFVPIHRIPNGVDTKKFNPQNPPLDFNLPHPIVLCTAALSGSKRIDLLIHAVSHLPSVSLLIVGQGPQKSYLNDLGRRLLPNRFQIHSFPHIDMPRVYTSCDLFSFPTASWESFGIVLLEAMSSGLGVVATDDPIRREIVGPAGLFVNPENSSAYAEALARGLKSDWKSKSISQARQYSWSIIAQKYSNLFAAL